MLLLLLLLLLLMLLLLRRFICANVISLMQIRLLERALLEIKRQKPEGCYFTFYSTRYTSHITSHVTRHTSHATRHTWFAAAARHSPPLALEAADNGLTRSLSDDACSGVVITRTRCCLYPRVDSCSRRQLRCHKMSSVKRKPL